MKNTSSKSSKTASKSEIVEKVIPQAERKRNLWILLAILVFTALIYFNSLQNGFIYFDDPELVTDNITIRQLSFENLTYYFTTPVQFTYLPMGLISYAIDYQIGQLNPFVYHLDSLIIHLLTVVLVFVVFLQLTQKSSVAIFVTVLYAIHPVNVDNVDWVATRNNLLATFYYLGALFFYSLYIKKNFQLRYLVLACISFIISGLSKSASVVLPLTLFLWDYFYGRKWEKRLLIEKIPFFLISLILGIMTLNIRTDVVPPVQYNPLDRVIVFCVAMVDYFARLLFPLQLSMSYAYPVKNGDFLPPQLYLAPIALALIILGLFWLKLSKKVLIVGLLFFFINITLSQSVMLIDNFMANRYAGLAYLGLFLILAEISERMLNAAPASWQSKLRVGWMALLVIFAVSFSVLTYTRNFVWKDTVSLFTDVIEKQPNVAWVYSNRGIAKYRAEDYDGALKDFNQALVIDPNFTLSFYYRGVLEYMSGDYETALADLDKTVYNDPRFADAYLQRGKVKAELNDAQGALYDMNQALSLNTYLIETYLARGMLKNNNGDYQGAIADFDTYILYAPDIGMGFYMRSIAKRNLGDQTGSCTDAAQGVALGYQPTPEEIDPNCQ